MKAQRKKSQSSPRKNSRFEALLAEAAKLQKQVRYSDKLLDTVTELQRELGGAKKSSPAYFKAKAIISEVMYYFGRVDAARKAVEDEAGLGAVLYQEDVSTLKKRALVREKVRCYQAYVIAKYYHGQLYDKARDELEKCRDFVKSKLVSKEHATFGLSTLGMSEYYLGRAYRQLGAYHSAEEAFTRAIVLFVKQAERKKEQSIAANSRKRSVEDDLAFLEHKVAVCSGLGLAWIDYTQAHLTTAEQRVTVAKATLLRFADEVDNAYMDLILGSIIHSKGGGKISQLLRAQGLVHGAREVFRRLGHGWYEPRATFELGQIHLALAHRDAERREQHLKLAKTEALLVRKSSVARKDWRWVVNSMVLQSEIERSRRNYDGATRLAEAALKEAARRGRANSLRVCEINALIARAVANIYFVRSQRVDVKSHRSSDADSSNYTARRAETNALTSAEADLKKALTLNESTDILRGADSQNSRIEALCRLYLALCYTYGGDRRRAEESYQKWLGIEGIEHARIHNLAGNIRKEIDEVVVEFVISSEDCLKYDELLQKLKSFLLNVARQKYKDKAKQAELLGITRVTHNKWISKEGGRVEREKRAAKKQAKKGGN